MFSSYDYIEEKIFKLIKSAKIREEILDRITSSDGKIKLQGNVLSSFLEKNEDSFIVELTDNSLHYQSQRDSTVVEIHAEQKEDKTIVNRMESEITTYKNLFMGKKNKHYNSRNIETKTCMYVYNKGGRETFRYKEEKHDNYFIHKKTGEVILHEPCVFENYIEQEYDFRETNGDIIKRIKKEYIYPEGSDRGHIRNEDRYYIGVDVDPENNDIPFGGHFYGFDAALYKEYKQGKCDTDKIWQSEDVKKLVKNQIHTVWI